MNLVPTPKIITTLKNAYNKIKIHTLSEVETNQILKAFYFRKGLECESIYGRELKRRGRNIIDETKNTSIYRSFYFPERK